MDLGLSGPKFGPAGWSNREVNFGAFAMDVARFEDGEHSIELVEMRLGRSLAVRESRIPIQ
jgi:hypothetical protein